MFTEYVEICIVLLPQKCNAGHKMGFIPISNNQSSHKFLRILQVHHFFFFFQCSIGGKGTRSEFNEYFVMEIYELHAVNFKPMDSQIIQFSVMSYCVNELL